VTTTLATTIDYRHDTGPFDIIGDVHGCCDELEELLAHLGWRIELRGQGDKRRADIITPGPHRIIFVGDLVDRGPRSPDVLRIVMALVESGRAHCVPGNHDDKFIRWLKGNPVKLTHGLEATTEQMATEPQSFHKSVLQFLTQLPAYLRLDGSNLIVAHAGITADLIGHTSERSRRFCLYGDTDGKTDENGLSLRYNWAARYHGKPLVVYGHTPVAEPTSVNNTLCIDTGCCFGGALTAFRYPERTFVAVPARKIYATRARPFGLPPARA
jgi:diadenosine tetraphosphatase ApaH/serine/threonine PP2A family protein phosphatase